MKAILSRKYLASQTLGRLILFNQDKVLLQLVTLELPDNGNQQNVSCIPEGKYEVHKITRNNGDLAFLVLNVPGRTDILIHKGNYNKDTHGCILPGIYFEDINEDGLVDVCESMAAMSRLLNLVDRFTLYVI